MVKHRNRQASNHSPCPTCNGAPPPMQRQHLPAPDCNPCFSAGDDPFLTGSLHLSRTPVSLRVADGQSQSPRPAMSFPRPLPSAPSRLPRPSPFPQPCCPTCLLPLATYTYTYRTVCYAVPGLHPVSVSPSVVSCLSLTCPGCIYLLHLSTQGPVFVSSGRSPSCLVLSCSV